MRDEDVKRYLHPKETRYYPLAVFAGAPFAIFFILMTIASFGIFALLAAGVLFLVWTTWVAGRITGQRIPISPCDSANDG